MPALKIAANALTIGRAVIGIIIGGLGAYQGRKALKAVVLLLMTAWFSDVADGFLARASKVKVKDWIGEHDLYADMTVSAGVLYYLTSSNYIPVYAGWGIFIGSVILLYYFPSTTLAEGLQAIPYALMIYTSFMHIPLYGFLIVAFLLFLIAITWPRFPKEKVPGFLNGMRNLKRRV
ncbi:MAG: hypothetical protein PWQ34_101 [Caldanaerobacter sp.]|uniref:CDP-alcohol phosphatidyltransferase family protein n=1 Tax=Caldanaerobacter sp. TaxID=2930036 RepID=UPI0024AC6383|nr:CDP-alcohol phosphatidyltransferase family protein [Caldanaerobacter sp.]MDI3517954.1 hypothetical protein [Caldanaerobacter sp.]